MGQDRRQLYSLPRTWSRRHTVSRALAMKHVTKTLLLLAPIWILVAQPIYGGQRPVQEHEMVVESRSDRTLDQVFALSPLVVEAVIEAERPADDVRERPGRPPVTRVATAFDLRILEVFKAKQPVKAGEIVEVRRDGGSRDRGTHIDRYTTTGHPMFEVGQRYILFLAGPTPSGYYGVSLNAEGAFLINGNTVRALGRRPSADEAGSMPPGQLRTRLRVLGGAR